MAKLIIRLPDDKHDRLKSLSKRKKTSVNELIEEFSTQAIAEFGAETRFRALAAGGSKEKGLVVLDKLHKHLSELSN